MRITPRRLFISCILFPSISGIFSSMHIILDSIELFSVHELIAPKPTIYFSCQGEKKIILPDLKEKHFLYKFKGVESWQPLVELPDKKCKRCGFYEQDLVKSDDVFDEWELCPDEFHDGNYVHYKEKEFNATFKCSDCAASAGSANPNNPRSNSVDKKLNVAMAILVGALTSLATFAAIFGMFKYWQKRKREHDHARFLKLFNEGDDIDDELELGN